MMKIYSSIFFATLLLLCPIGHKLQAQIQTGTVTDVEGNVYRTVKVGDYWWMCENLRTRHYQNGEAVTMYPDSVFANYGDGKPSTGGSTYDGRPHWTFVNHDSTNMGVYGLNYTWYAAMDSRGLCPEGWELPDTSVWYSMARTLKIGASNFAGPEDYGWTDVGVYLKSPLYWQSSTAAKAVNDSLGFNVVPSGYMDSNGYVNFGISCGFWTPNYVHANKSGGGRRYMSFGHASDNMWLSQYRANTTMSIRCVKKVTSTTGFDPAKALGGVCAAYRSAEGELNFAGLSATNTDLTLYTMNGQPIIHTTATTDSFTWHVGQLPQGVYLVTIKNETGSKVVKIMAL